MSLELQILNGSRPGRRERFTQPTITIGRHPHSDLRFDPERDLDVSAHHAEIRAAGDTYVLRDTDSTNGTFVNGVRIAGSHVLRSGDVISLGELGPRVAVTLEARSATPPPTAPSPAMRRDTTARIAVAVSERTRALRRVIGALAGCLVAGVGAAYWVGHRDASAREAQLQALARANDSLSRAYAARITALAGRVDGLDSSLAASKTETDALRRALSTERAGGRADSLATELRALESRRHAMLTAAQVDYSAISKRNGAAVTLIAVEWPDGTMFSGTGFAVDSLGTIVTNRHLVSRDSAQTPTRIAVIFSDTKDWLPAHVVRVGRDADLALIKLDVAGPFPTIAHLAPSATTAAVGKAVAIIGYPLGTDTPMEGSGTKITARSTLVAGTVSKHLATVIQIDAYAGEGSSGSPVFDVAGNVVGVVYGGAKESAGRIVYAVPSDAVARLIAP